MRQSRFKRICVFCGSSQGKKRSYHDAAIELGNELVARSIDLVYGGGSIGLMGLVSQAVFDGGRHVIGVIPKTLMTPEISGETVGEVRPVADMHQRKAEMARQSDAFIALPGGYGTLEELLEVITWAQLGIHHKPVGLLNVDGYYNSLLTFIDKAVEEGFINTSARRIIVMAPTAEELMDKLEEYVPYHDRVASKLNWEMGHLVETRGWVDAEAGFDWLDSGLLDGRHAACAGKLIANLIVMGSGIIGRAMLQAYRKALDNANKTGVAHETINNIRRASKTMTEQEARQILGVSEQSTWEEIAQRYDNLFERNAKSGSFYLQSKVHRAKECLENVYQKNKQDGTPP
ncbi:hypothetical protein OsI_34046 [Oryza sativa Indica Group]|uniref:cytokinin riboside 5'-monophosphate phosphoribohydrolase n=1 Tax=Oryza sativa subsp. indica TaxID=39946 RepID=B8BHH6_ORYSI|nr:hypothetical protein OsI_34046 [Oryza sativa Indica Group]EEE51147.1 hypothetical protein OsJ_31908 [Oryza sativa Japonica Group]